MTSSERRRAPSIAAEPRSGGPTAALPDFPSFSADSTRRGQPFGRDTALSRRLRHLRMAPRAPGPPAETADPLPRRERHRASRVSLAIDAGLAPATFYSARGLGLSLRASLLIATAVATARLVGTAVRNRKPDAVAAFVLGSYAVMLAIALLAHDERLLLARDPVTSALAGLVFLGSCAVGRPAIGLLSERIQLPHRAREPDPALRRSQTVQTAVWGTVLLVESAGRPALVYTLPINVTAGVGQLIEPMVLAVVGAWSARYARRTRRCRTA
ncbi:VC0807 family protein [Streptomyces sp. NPDC020096]